jgi:dihydroorotate dehydrogenase
VQYGFDAIIATNTTLDRSQVQGLQNAQESGGLSGAPLQPRAVEVVAKLHRRLGRQTPIIGVGGILRGSDACELMQAGASLVQIYTGFIYRGPALISECVDALQAARLVPRHTS